MVKVMCEYVFYYFYFYFFLFCSCICVGICLVGGGRRKDEKEFVIFVSCSLSHHTHPYYSFCFTSICSFIDRNLFIVKRSNVFIYLFIYFFLIIRTPTNFLPFKSLLLGGLVTLDYDRLVVSTRPVRRIVFILFSFFFYFTNLLYN